MIIPHYSALYLTNMGHHCCSKQKVKRGLWSPEEDEKLMNHIANHGHGCWSSVPKLAGLQRRGKSCRLRWINYLRPDLKRGTFSANEERIIIDVHRILGNRWAQIAKHLPGRTDNEVKNFWNSCIKKKLMAHGLDPKTHNLMPAASRANINANNYNIHNVSDLSQFQTATIPFTINTSSNNGITNSNLGSIFPMQEYQDPDVLMSFKDQDSHDLMDYASCNNELMDEACIWVNGGGSNVVNQEGLVGPLKQNVGIEEEQAQAHEMIDNAEYNASTFDLDLMDPELMSCGIFGGSSMEPLQWDCYP